MPNKSLARQCEDAYRYDDGLGKNMTGSQLREILKQKYGLVNVDPTTKTLRFLDGSEGTVKMRGHVIERGAMDVDAQDCRTEEELVSQREVVIATKPATRELINIPGKGKRWIDSNE